MSENANVQKSVEITDAKIQFVSLVDRAANMRRFLITKGQDGGATFTTCGRILKVDKESHYVTGIVYEPMTADSDDNFMTAAEIEKAAHTYMKNHGGVDVQHSFEAADNVYVVESSVTKEDCTIDGNEIKAGTWIMTIEIANSEIWKAVEDEKITGLSMGGIARYATVETDLTKGSTPDEPLTTDQMQEPQDVQKDEKLGLFKRLAKMFGMDVVEKGAVRDAYEKRSIQQRFWTAFDALQSQLSHYDYYHDATVFETDEENVREALEDFNAIITELLTDKEIAKPLAKARAETGTPAAAEKAGKKMSGPNKAKLTAICQSLNDFLAEFDDQQPDTPDDPDDDHDDDPNDKEEIDMSKDDVQKMIDEAVKKAMSEPVQEPAAAPDNGAPAEPQNTPTPDTPAPEAPTLTAESAQKMIDAAIEKAMSAPAAPTEEPPAEVLDEIKVSKMIGDAIAKALQARTTPTQIENPNPVTKAEEPHYLAGIL